MHFTCCARCMQGFNDPVIMYQCSLPLQDSDITLTLSRSLALGRRSILSSQPSAGTSSQPLPCVHYPTGPGSAKTPWLASGRHRRGSALTITTAIDHDGYDQHQIASHGNLGAPGMASGRYRRRSALSIAHTAGLSDTILPRQVLSGFGTHSPGVTTHRHRRGSALTMASTMDLDADLAQLQLVLLRSERQRTSAHSVSMGGAELMAAEDA